MEEPISQLRIDPVIGRKVLISEDRARRPNDYSSRVLVAETRVPTKATVDTCPFCVGHESQTPPSLVELLDERGHWRVRVVPNKFPAVSGGAPKTQDDFKRPHASSVLPLPQQAWGSQEVLIESPRHVQDFLDLSIDETASVLKVYRDRLRYWANEMHIQHALLFKNVGFAAGASLEHAHGQLIALPYVPETVAAEIDGTRRYYSSQKKCVFCQLLQEELQDRKRFVAEEGPFIAFCAYAGRQPYEMWIMPMAHAPRFEFLTDEEATLLAKLFYQVLQRLACLVSPLSYNLILHTAPFHESREQHYHWHWELVPRSCQLAGFEWGSGVYINPLSPERAASLLQKVKS